MIFWKTSLILTKATFVWSNYKMFYYTMFSMFLEQYKWVPSYFGVSIIKTFETNIKSFSFACGFVNDFFQVNSHLFL